MPNKSSSHLPPQDLLRTPEAASGAARGPGRPRDAERTGRRRREILEIATRKFAEQGFASTDLQQMADELRVGKGTIYRYFPSKEELFLAAVDLGMEHLRAAVDQAAEEASDDVHRIERGIHAYLKFFDDNPQMIELIIQERAHFRDREKATYFIHQEASIGPWRDLLQRLIAQGVVREVPVQRATDVISDLLYGTIFTNHFAGRRKSLVSQCEDVLDIIFRGLLVNQRN